MASEVPWTSDHPSSWRDGDYHHGHGRPHWSNFRDLQYRQPSPPVDVQRPLQSSFLSSQDSQARGKASKAHEVPSCVGPQTPMLPAWISEPSTTDTSASHSLPHNRHSPPALGHSGPQQSAGRTANTFAGSWRNLHNDDRRESITPHPEVPLSLHIPKIQEKNPADIGFVVGMAGSSDTPLPTEDGSSSRSQAQYESLPTPSQSTTSLPSFAAFEAHASRFEDPEVDGPEIAPMASRLSCSLCTKLRPMVREVCLAVAELDESVQSYCSGSVTRALDFPQDSPVRAVQWILDRLRYAKLDMQAAAVRKDVSADCHHQKHGLISSSPPSMSHPSKRSRTWDETEYPLPKRPRSGASVDHPAGSRHVLDYPAARRASVDFAAPDRFRSGYSPPPTESAPGSAFPKMTSPPLTGLQAGAIPSPASLAYLPSGAPSMAAPTVRSIGSPATSYIPPSSIHTASSSSATSAHIADLQHQVTLKSLALQTLQSEYASMLQKLQRERVKSQTIERKTTVADQEVNDLTGKAEDLSEQVKTLEAQLEESEKKREADRANAARDKEQWGRMLEMDGKIHAKNAEEKQRLAEERDALQRRLDAYEGDAAIDETKRDVSSRNATRTIAATSDIGNVLVLRREVNSLREKIDHLASALKQARNHNEDLRMRMQDFVQQSGDMRGTIDAALDGIKHINVGSKGISKPDQDPGYGQVLDWERPTGGHGPSNSPHHQTFNAIPSTSMDSFRPLSSYTAPVDSYLPRVTLPPTSAPSNQTARITGGHPDPAFNVQRNRSSPEELMKALGPAPAPLFPILAQPPHTASQPDPPLIKHTSPYEEEQSRHANASRPVQDPSYHPQNTSPNTSRGERSPPGSMASSSIKPPSPEEAGHPRRLEQSRLPEPQVQPQGPPHSNMSYTYRRYEPAAAQMPPPPRPLNGKD